MSLPVLPRPFRTTRRLAAPQVGLHPAAMPMYRLWLGLSREFVANTLIREELASTLVLNTPLLACAVGERWSVFANFELYVAVRELAAGTSLPVEIHEYRGLSDTDVGMFSLAALIFSVERNSLCGRQGVEHLRGTLKDQVDYNILRLVLQADVRSRAAFASSTGYSPHVLKRQAARSRAPDPPLSDFVAEILTRRSHDDLD